MQDTRDAYARLPFQSDRMLRAHSTGGGLAFLDIAHRTAGVETVAGYLRDVPLDVVGRVEWVLARWGPENQDWPPADQTADALQQLLGDMGSNAKLGVIPFEVGSKPSIVWSSTASGTGSLDQVLLARARAAEMEAFLRWGQALWLPDSYHYVLPSGKHTASFIRLADAFQDMRAAPALATWLYEALSGDAPTTLVMDIGTLMPLVSELQVAADRHRAATAGSSARVGTVLPLDRYPSNALGLQRSLLHTSPDSPMLGLVSVSDSGGFAERLLSAFSALGAPTVRIEQLISRKLPGATSIPPESGQSNSIEDPWLSLVGFESAEPDDGECVLCKDPRRARLVRINPRAMSAMVLPEPDLVVPDIFDARRNTTIWEAYKSTQDQDQAISLLGPTGTRPAPPTVRSVEETVFFEPAPLVKEAPGELISKRLAEFSDFPKRNREDKMRDLVQGTLDRVADNASIVIYEQQERALFLDQEWENLRVALSEHDFVDEQAVWIGYTTEEGLEQIAIPSNRDVPSALILALGSRTGLSCQRMFLAGRQKWPGASFRGLVVHAHPEDERIWASIRNTFTDSEGNKRLLALWLTYIPNWSPLAVERDTYRAAQHRGLDIPELAKRIEELESVPQAGCTLLGSINPRLEPHSYFGQSLGSRETLCAVGAAMQAARIQARPRGAPHWNQFDLRRVLRSYFDWLIHASILRWCEPHEAWWGQRGSDCVDFLQELEGVDFDFTRLLPELLLACAQEKLPEEATAHLVAIAPSHLSKDMDDRTRGHLKLGIDLCNLALEET